MTRRHHVARALPVAVVASLTVLAGCSNGKSTPPTTQVTPTSSESAAGALRQAALGMEAASSYRFVGTVSAGGHTVSLSGEFAAPDRLHEVITIAGTPPVERIMIGSTAYQRSGSTWRAVGSAAKTSSDPRATFAALAQVTTVTGQGPVYSFTMAGAAASALVSGPSTGSVTGTVTLANNTISDLAFRSPVASGTAVHFTYSDIGSAPPIVAPQVPA